MSVLMTDIKHKGCHLKTTKKEKNQQLGNEFFLCEILLPMKYVKRMCKENIHTKENIVKVVAMGQIFNIRAVKSMTIHGSL